MESVPLAILERADGPGILLDVIEGDGPGLVEGAYSGRQGPLALKRLRGKKMRSYQGLMSEFGAALQFFDGFGENWPALEELLGYLDEWLPAGGYILFVSRADLLLVDDVDEIEIFLRLVRRVCEWWAKPIIDNPPFDRPAMPFHLVLEVQLSELEEALRKFEGCPVLST